MARAFLGLGTNLGDRASNLRRALRLLGEAGLVRRVSSLYETEPMGYADQPWFLNIACELETELSPRDLLAVVKRIEHQMGRVPSIRYGPRLIDIDILLYDGRTLDLPELQVPHASLPERRFALAPLAEIAPEALHAGLGKTVEELLRDLPAGETVRRCPRTEGWLRQAEPVERSC